MGVWDTWENRLSSPKGASRFPRSGFPQHLKSLGNPSLRWGWSSCLHSLSPASFAGGKQQPGPGTGWGSILGPQGREGAKRGKLIALHGCGSGSGGRSGSVPPAFPSSSRLSTSSQQAGPQPKVTTSPPSRGSSSIYEILPGPHIPSTKRQPPGTPPPRARTGTSHSQHLSPQGTQAM